MKARRETAPSRFEVDAWREPNPPFGSIEGSRDYVALLLQSIDEAAAEVAEELRLSRDAGGRRREAFQLIAYKLETLGAHLGTSRRLLNDLRALRHMVVDSERPPAGESTLTPRVMVTPGVVEVPFRRLRSIQMKAAVA